MVTKATGRTPQITTTIINTNSPSFNEQIPDLPPPLDSFEVSNNSKTLSSATRNKVDAIINDYSKELQKLLHHDIESIAQGYMPIRDNSQIPKETQDKIFSATKDLLKGMPIEALSPVATKELTSFLQDQGMSTKDLNTKTLNGLGKEGQKLSKKWAKELKGSNPSVYYGLIGAASVAIGSYGYLEGSEGLKKLGLKPKFRSKLFNKKVQIQAEATWDKHFKNFAAQGDISGNYNYKNLELRFNSKLNSKELDKTTTTASLRVGTDKAYLEGGITANTHQITEYSFNAHKNIGKTQIGNLTLNSNATFDKDFDFTKGNINATTTYNHGSSSLNLDFGDNYSLDQITANTTYKQGDFNINAGVAHQFQTDETTANISANYHSKKFNISGSATHNFSTDATTATISSTYKHTQNLEFGLNASYDNQNNSKVTAGVKWRF